MGLVVIISEREGKRVASFLVYIWLNRVYWRIGSAQPGPFLIQALDPTRNLWKPLDRIN